MRKPHPARTVSAIAAVFMLSACLSDDETAPTIRGRFGSRLEGLPPLSLLDSSRLALGMMKALSGDAYSYRMGYRGFLGGSGEWTVTVRGGAPVRLDFESVDGEGRVFRKTETAADWASSGEPRDPRLPEPMTLDSIYALCRAILEDCGRPERSGFGPPEAYFRSDADYILSDCGCQDPAIMDGHPSVALHRLRWARK